MPRILQAIGVCLVLFHAAQTFAGEYPLAGVLVFGLAGAGMVGFRLDVLRSVRTAVVLLAALSISCILGTLTVQRSQLAGANEAEFRQTAQFAWAHLAYKISHPFPGDDELAPDQSEHLQRVATVFGEDAADEKRAALVKGRAAAASEAAARELAAAHPAPFTVLYRFAAALGLIDLYRAWWFAGLFYLLAANLLAGAVVRRKPAVRNVGFHASHLGLVLVVLGATAGAFSGSRGMLPLEVGGDASTMLVEGGQQPLGFTVRLDDFETLYHEDLVIEALAYSDPGPDDMGHGATRPLRHTVKLEEGATFSFTDPESGDDYELTLEAIEEAVSLRRSHGPAESGGVAAVALDTAGAAAAFGLVDPVWLSTDDPLFIHPANGYKVRIEDWDGEPLDSLGLDCEPGIGTLTMAEDGGEPLQARIVEGGEFTLGRFTGRAEEVVSDFRVGEMPEAPAGFPRNPALRVQLTDEAGEGGRFLMFSDPRLKDFTELPWEGVQASFDYDYWCAPTPIWMRILVAEDGTALAAGFSRPPLVARPEGLDGEASPATVPDVVPRPLAPGDALLSIPHISSPVFVARIEGRAAERTELVGAKQAAAEGLEGPARTALKLRIDGPASSEQRWLLSNTEQGASWIGRDAGDDGTPGTTGFGVLLANNTERPPRDWRSHLTFLEEGSEVASGALEVNTPASYAGYAFFQSDADPRRPGYSGLSVVRDPAWPLVKAGLWALLAGICWCFYVQPLFDRRRRAAQRVAAGASNPSTTPTIEPASRP